MRTELDKKMRIAEIAASLTTLFLLIIYNGILQVVFNLDAHLLEEISLLVIPYLEDFSILVILLMFLFGKIRNAPWNKIIGVLYAVMIIPNISRIGSVVNAISNFKDVPFPVLIVASKVFDITFIIGAVICVLMYLGVVRFRKRSGLLILMYVFIVCGFYVSIFSYATLSRVLIIIWGICFHNENAETDCKKGKAARTAVFLLIPVTLFLALGRYIIEFLSSVAHITEDGLEATDFIMAIGLIVICFVSLMPLPLLLFDKKFEIDETAEKADL